MTSAQSRAVERILSVIPSDWFDMTYAEQKSFLIGAASACYDGPTTSLLTLLVAPVMDTVGFADQPVPDGPSRN
jgi:hypothetical protein